MEREAKFLLERLRKVRNHDLPELACRHSSFITEIVSGGTNSQIPEAETERAESCGGDGSSLLRSYSGVSIS